MGWHVLEGPTPTRLILSGCGSTATSGPSGNWRKRASPRRPWTTDSALAPIPKRCRASVIGWVRGPCAASSGLGGGVCLLPSAPRTSRPVTPTSWPSASSRSPTPVSLTDFRPGGWLPSGDGLASVRPLVERLCRRALTRCLTLLDQFVNFFSTKGSLVACWWRAR